MALRRTVRLVITGAFALMLVPVVGDFFVEIARENGLYNRPTARVQAVVDWAQSIFGEQGFFWLLFGLGGLAAGLWLDLALKRREPDVVDPLVRMAERLGLLMGMAPDPSFGGAWGSLSPKGTTWHSELNALHFLMMKAGFKIPPTHLEDDWEDNLDAHREHWAHLVPYIETGQIAEARAANALYVERLTGQNEEIEIVERPSLLRRLLGAKPKLLSPPDTEAETPQ